MSPARRRPFLMPLVSVRSPINKSQKKRQSEFNMLTSRIDTIKNMNEQTIYRIKFKIAVYSQDKSIYQREIMIPTVYEKRSQCREHIQCEIQSRLKNAFFFISPRIDYDLVRYTREASHNTYIRYRIISEKIVQQPMKSSKRTDQWVGDNRSGGQLEGERANANEFFADSSEHNYQSSLNARRMFELRAKIFPHGTAHLFDE